MKKILLLLLILLSACTKTEDDCLVKYDFAKSIEDLSSSELIVYGKFLEVVDNVYTFRATNQFNYDIKVRDFDIVINNKLITESEYCAAEEYIEYTVDYNDVYLLFLEWDNENEVFIPAYQQFAFIKTGDETIAYDDVFVKDDLLGYASGLGNEITINEILETLN
ncbi:hypothetical protein RJG79_09725 [Mycoplasmatota bacterium WC44]